MGLETVADELLDPLQLNLDLGEVVIAAGRGFGLLKAGEGDSLEEVGGLVQPGLGVGGSSCDLDLEQCVYIVGTLPGKLGLARDPGEVDTDPGALYEVAIAGLKVSAECEED